MRGGHRSWRILTRARAKSQLPGITEEFPEIAPRAGSLLPGINEEDPEFARDLHLFFYLPEDVLVEKILDNSLRMFVTLAATRKLLADYLSGLSKKFPVRVVHRWPLRPIESAQYAWNIHTSLAIWRDLMHGYNVLCLVLRHLARMEFVEEIQMHPDQDYGVVFRRWGVKYGFLDFLEHFSVPQANGRARCILGNRPVERF